MPSWSDVPAELQTYAEDAWADRGARDAWRVARDRWGREHGVSVMRLALDRIRADVWRMRGLPEEDDRG